MGFQRGRYGVLTRKVGFGVGHFLSVLDFGRFLGMELRGLIRVFEIIRMSLSLWTFKGTHVGQASRLT